MVESKIFESSHIQILKLVNFQIITLARILFFLCKFVYSFTQRETMNIVVTGVSKGIGREIVKILSEKEENRIIAVTRKIDNTKYAQNVIPIAFDLEQMLSYIEEILLEQIMAQVSKIDILINNAGYLEHKPFGEFSLEKAKRIFDVNFFAPAMLTKALIPLMGKKMKSHVVNIGSMGGVQGSSKFAGLSYYSSSKAALANLTECLAEEYKDKNITFNCLALGAVQTEMLAHAFPNYVAPVNAKQMADFIVNFALNGHQFFNGKIIPVALSTP